MEKKYTIDECALALHNALLELVDFEDEETNIDFTLEVVQLFIKKLK